MNVSTVMKATIGHSSKKCKLRRARARDLRLFAECALCLNAWTMTRFGSRLVAAVLVAAALSACVDTSPPVPQPTTGESPTPSESRTPTESPSKTPSPSPSVPPPSNPPPQRVEGLTAETGGGSGEVLLRWTQNPEQDVVSYIVLRASSPGGPLTRIGTVTWQEVTEFEFVPFVDSEATVGYYRVRAVDSADQEGSKSAEVCGASVGYSC